MHKFRIVLTGPGRGEVFMDGEMVEGVRAVALRAAVGEMNMVTLTFDSSEVEVDGEADITTIGDDSRKFAKVA